MREITVFSIGDANKLNTWSNVPYFFTKSLEAQEIKINRVNLQENSTLAFIYKYSIFIILKLFYENSNHTFFRTGLNNFLMGIKIKSALKKYKHADATIFLSYSFSPKKYLTAKTILFGDWTYSYYINKLLKRQPYWFEQKALKREEANINSANSVFSLFPKSLEFNLLNYNNPQQFYLGNVINCNFPIDKNNLLNLKLKSKKILFIGTRKYLKDAIHLISAFEQINSKKSLLLELHIIGLTKNEVNIELPELFYHGYLDKGIQTENELYYKLISEARVVINTNSNWGAFSAMTEAMYYYTPIITAPYEEFVEIYGSEINFGYYVTTHLLEELTEKIETMCTINDTIYTEFMLLAHAKVKAFTWDNYTKKLLAVISKLE